MSDEAACNPKTPMKCDVNMGRIHLQAGDFVSAYRYFLPWAEDGNAEAIAQLVEICELAGDSNRAATWAAKLTESGSQTTELA